VQQSLSSELLIYKTLLFIFVGIMPAISYTKLYWSNKLTCHRLLSEFVVWRGMALLLKFSIL